MATPASAEALWWPSADAVSSSRTARFRETVNAKFGLRLAHYDDLLAWSIAHPGDFWAAVWDDTAVVAAAKGAHVVDVTAKPADSPVWFADARLNWAANMLRCRDPAKRALVELVEPHPRHPTPALRELSYAGLYALVADLVSALLGAGLVRGDRVASYSSNCIENVAACLAATAIGCVWISAAADFGADGVLERFEQVQPSLIFTVDAVSYNGKIHPHVPKVRTLLSGLAQKGVPAPRVVVIDSAAKGGAAISEALDPSWVRWDAFVAEGTAAKRGRTPEGEIEFAQLPFDWPLWILFSSGTTGLPKPIVHRAGGMLLQSLKEHHICSDMVPDDVFFYYTTTGWMMWNYLISALSVGCTLVLYDGSPLRQPELLWSAVDDLGITIFGTSAKYLEQLAKGYTPKDKHSLVTLRHIYSTGSPLAPAQYDWVYENIKSDVLLGSITGGTDICSLFAGHNTSLPVYREIQCRMLGMAIAASDPEGNEVPRGEAGELVCTKPAPCMPIGFWPLPGFGAAAEKVAAAQERYRQAYFPGTDGAWWHGDYVCITPARAHNGGGVVMLGRSDGVLNPGGVRFGSAELYDVIEREFAGAGGPVVDCIAVGQTLAGGTDERVVLGLQLAEGTTLTKELQDAIKLAIRTRRSPRHVPAVIVQVRSVPTTLNGKRVEVPVKKIINGASMASVNPATLRNPESLEEYVALGAKLRAEL